VAYGLAAATLAAGVLAGLALRHRIDGRSQELAEELVGDHLRSVAEAMPTEVTTSDPQDVIRFFSGKIPFQPVVPRLGGTRLLGGRLCKIAGRRVELLFYRMDSGTVDSTLSLFVSDQPLGSDACRESRGLAVCGQRLRGLTLLLIGKGPPAELLRLLEGATS
jgi:anti-sigma factor RsiW